MDQECQDCEAFLPSYVRPHLGLCKFSEAKDELVRGDETSCQRFKVRSFTQRVRTSDYYWCGTCRETIYFAYLPRHRKHSVFKGVYVDPDAHISTFAAD